MLALAIVEHLLLVLPLSIHRAVALGPARSAQRARRSRPSPRRQPGKAMTTSFAPVDSPARPLRPRSAGHRRRQRRRSRPQAAPARHRHRQRLRRPGRGGAPELPRASACTVLEKLDAPGGRAYVWRQDGFTFDAGPTIITAPFMLEELWALAGKQLRRRRRRCVPLDPFYRIRFDDGTLLRLQRRRRRDARRGARASARPTWPATSASSPRPSTATAGLRGARRHRLRHASATCCAPART